MCWSKELKTWFLHWWVHREIQSWPTNRNTQQSTLHWKWQVEHFSWNWPLDKWKFKRKYMYCLLTLGLKYPHSRKVILASLHKTSNIHTWQLCSFWKYFFKTNTFLHHHCTVRCTLMLVYLILLGRELWASQMAERERNL